MKKYIVGYKEPEEVEEEFPTQRVIQYLQLKLERKTRKEIIQIMHFGADYAEQRFRTYILNEMQCNSINQAIITAYKLGWVSQKNNK